MIKSNSKDNDNVKHKKTKKIFHSFIQRILKKKYITVSLKIFCKTNERQLNVFFLHQINAVLERIPFKNITKSYQLQTLY